MEHLLGMEERGGGREHERVHLHLHSEADGGQPWGMFSGVVLGDDFYNFFFKLELGFVDSACWLAAQW